VFHTLVKMSFEFDHATHAVLLGDGVYDTAIEDRWDINGNANGGYLLALVANAMREASGRAHPISVSMHYLAPGPAGPAQTHTEVVKAGRRLATVVASLRRDGKDLVRSIGTFGDIDATQGPQSLTIAPPELPAFDDCPTRPVNGPAPLGLSTRLDMRLHPDDTGFARNEPNGRARVRGWFAFADDRPVDTLALLLAADAFPPVMFNLFGMQGWVPTIEFTVHVRAVPAPGPIACVFENHVVQGGYWEEDGAMWDSNGQLVAMSRQLALVPLT
jgi:acyl-CoA thioesterase